MKHFIQILCAAAAMHGELQAQSNQNATSSSRLGVTPLLWGFDGSHPPERLAQRIFDEFSVDFVVHHYQPVEKDSIRDLQRWSDFYSRHHVAWILNLEVANWNKSFVDASGFDWFNLPDGRHYFHFPEEVLSAISRFKLKPGIMYDEAEHMQNTRNGFSGLDRPFFLDGTKVASLEQASSEFLRETENVAETYRKYGLSVYSEHVFPIQFHNFAAAGFTPATKLLKEGCMPAYIACALGAAIQYGRPLWFTPDLWQKRNYPGHTPKEYATALLLAYHMGAECIYTENIYMQSANGRWRGGLILINDQKDDYTLTELGQVAKRFRGEYVPSHPRNYSFRQLKPRVAIIRQEDTCWGQSDSWLSDQLFGVAKWKSTKVTEAWLQIWNLLSNGQISPDSISWHNNKVITPYRSFYPLDGVVVFDEKVGAGNLENVELIFLTGLGVSDATLKAVSECVSRGAVCVALPHLVPPAVRLRTGAEGSLEQGRGRWLVTESFLTEKVRLAARPVLPRENYIRYRFGDAVVEFRPVGDDMNDITATVSRAGVTSLNSGSGEVNKFSPRNQTTGALQQSTL